INVKRRSLRIVAKPDRAILVSHAGQRNPIAYEQVAREEPLMTFMAMDDACTLLIHQFLKLGVEAFVTFFVVRLVTENDVAVAVEGDAVLGVRQILRCEPEVERMVPHDFKREPRSNRRRAAAQRVAVQLAHERYVAHRIWEVRKTEVEVVYRQRLLKDR